MLNARLAMDYRIAGVEGDGFRRVTLRPEDNRGGLLTQAAILSLTSDGTRHRPVHRGVWVSESILGRTPPPPPANVDPIEPNPVDAPEATLRMKLAAHKAHAQCASCHRKIDPLGLAFENFDAIGRWRTVESVPPGKGADPPVDASGELPDGRRFADARGFKRLPPDEPDASARPFVGGGRREARVTGQGGKPPRRTRSGSEAVRRVGRRGRLGEVVPRAVRPRDEPCRRLRPSAPASGKETEIGVARLFNSYTLRPDQLGGNHRCHASGFPYPRPPSCGRPRPRPPRSSTPGA
jgi:hypothetical protein